MLSGVPAVAGTLKKNILAGQLVKHLQGLRLSELTPLVPLITWLTVATTVSRLTVGAIVKFDLMLYLLLRLKLLL